MHAGQIYFFLKMAIHSQGKLCYDDKITYENVQKFVPDMNIRKFFQIGNTVEISASEYSEASIFEGFEFFSWQHCRNFYRRNF